MSTAPDKHLRISVSEEQHAVILHLNGELDVATAPDLDAALARAGNGEASTIIIDLRELSFMDSTGLRAILGAHARAEESGSRLGLVRGSDQVQRLLSLTRVAERLEIVDRPEDLLAPR